MVRRITPLTRKGQNTNHYSREGRERAGKISTQEYKLLVHISDEMRQCRRIDAGHVKETNWEGKRLKKMKEGKNH